MSTPYEADEWFFYFVLQWPWKARKHWTPLCLNGQIWTMQVYKIRQLQLKHEQTGGISQSCKQSLNWEKKSHSILQLLLTKVCGLQSVVSTRCLHLDGDTLSAVSRSAMMPTCGEERIDGKYSFSVLRKSNINAKPQWLNCGARARKLTNRYAWMADEVSRNHNQRRRYVYAHNTLCVGHQVLDGAPKQPIDHHQYQC